MAGSDKPNIIFLVVDALCFESLKRSVAGEEVMPFLNKLRRESAVANWDEAFSLAPYTEAAFVSMLGLERTLDSGGYFYSNGNCKETLMEVFQKRGYRTLFAYSPYIYSKSYLRGVTDWYYVRRYSIQPLLTYRLNYYRDVAKDGSDDRYLRPCRLLVEEAFETWLEQLSKIAAGDWSAKGVVDVFRLPEESAKKVALGVESEYARFCADSNEYVRELVADSANHELVRLNDVYIQPTRLRYQDEIVGKYEAKLSGYQDAFSRQCHRQRPDIRYLASTLIRNGGLRGEFLRLVLAYRRFYRNTLLSSYFDEVYPRGKIELSLEKQSEIVLCEAERYDKAGAPFAVYFQPQDFHLPSVFHTVDVNDDDLVDQEMEEAFSLLDSIDDSYRGNIVADLSARYCDAKIKSFYSRAKQRLKNEFVLVITADHGYPSYDSPPRPMVYNQTYSEAFHVPFIVAPGGNADLSFLNGKEDAVVSSLNLIRSVVFSREEGNREAGLASAGSSVVCEYAGPGCPDLTTRPVWYTGISDDYRLSLECSLSRDVEISDIKAVFNRKCDPHETINRKNKAMSESGATDLFEGIRSRHSELRQRFDPESFLSDITDSLV